jgi:osmoprotectant transport system permease protein
MLGTGVGLKPAIIAIILYNVLPIITNTNTGMSNVNAGLGKVLGMSKLQTLVYIELPMASPMILTGIKLAIISASSCAVLGAIIGAPGLGYYIYSGIAQMRYYLCIIGAIPTTLISLALDMLMNKLIKFASNKVRISI